jgi:uncharacterized protein YeaO (DUF488 family)
MKVLVKRIYESAAKSDGFRVLVEDERHNQAVALRSFLLKRKGGAGRS